MNWLTKYGMMHWLQRAEEPLLDAGADGEEDDARDEDGPSMATALTGVLRVDRQFLRDAPCP